MVSLFIFTLANDQPATKTRFVSVLAQLNTANPKTKLFASSEVPIFQVFSDKNSDGSAASDSHMREGELSIAKVDRPNDS